MRFTVFRRFLQNLRARWWRVILLVSVGTALLSVAAHGQEAVRQGPRRRLFLTAVVSMPVLTYAAPIGSRGSETFWPTERFALSQLVGGGYVVNPRFRLGVLAIFNEVFTGLPPRAQAWQLGAVAPVAIGRFGNVVFGGGPVLAYRSGGTARGNTGVVILTGITRPLGNGFALNLMAPTAALFARRFIASVGVGAGVSKVF